MKLKAIKAVTNRFKKLGEHLPLEEDFIKEEVKEKMMNDLLTVTNESIRLLNAWLDQEKRERNRPKFQPQWFNDDINITID